MFATHRPPTRLSTFISLVAKKIDDGTDLSQFERMLIDEEAQNRLPKLLMLKLATQSSFRDLLRQSLVSTQAHDLRPADRGDGWEMLRSLEEPVIHLSGHSTREAERAQAAAQAQMFEPRVLRKHLSGREVKPDRIQTSRDRVSS